MINVGIIGFGKMGRLRAKSVDANSKGQVISVYDVAKTKTDYDQVTNYEEIINDPKIDAVFVCTPNRYNKEVTIRALQAGKHVFCEKPPAFTTLDVQEIIKNEEKSMKKLMYGFNHRHHESIKHIKTLIDSKEYGKIIWMRGRYGKSVDKSFFNSWRAKKEYVGGGILLDQGIHMLDLFVMLGGEFDKVLADVSNQYWGLDIEDNVFAIYKNTKDKITASLHSTMTQWRHLFSLEVFLEKGYMVLNGLKTSSGTYGDEILSIAKNRTSSPAATWEDEEHIKYETNVSWASEVNHFFECILNDSPIKIGNSKDALYIMKLIQQTYSSGG